MSDAARSAAAGSMSAMEFPSDAAAMPPGAELPEMPPEGGDPSADIESAIEQIAAALEAISPDAASKARSHIEAIREIVASADVQAPPAEEEIPAGPEAEAPLGGGLEGVQ